MSTLARKHIKDIATSLTLLKGRTGGTSVLADCCCVRQAEGTQMLSRGPTSYLLNIIRFKILKNLWLYRGPPRYSARQSFLGATLGSELGISPIFVAWCRTGTHSAYKHQETKRSATRRRAWVLEPTPRTKLKEITGG
eukprot:1186059-Prorocentrum_minimum.AAC.1